MSDELIVKGFRGFKDYRVNGLRRVNLLVGRNNSGKTSLLEACYLLGTYGHPASFGRLARQRGETVYLAENEHQAGAGSHYPDISHFFHDHELDLGRTFSINGVSSGSLSVTVDAFESDEPMPSGLAQDLSAGNKWIKIQHSAAGTRLGMFRLSGRGALTRNAIARQLREWHLVDPAEHNVVFSTPQSLETMPLAAMWDTTVLGAREGDVVEALKILLPSVTEIFFLSTTPTTGPNTTGIVLSVENEKRRIPLGSFGEGMRRMLALALSLVQTSGGMLLVDEIDTGLHYSVLADMWRMVLETAIRSNVTVLATTHSRDCIAGLAEVCERYPHLSEEVSLQKIDDRLPEAVAFDASEIVLAAHSGIEVR